MAEKLVLAFTRDFSLAVTQWWRKAVETSFEETLGTSYSDQIAASNGKTTCYFYLEKDQKQILSVFLQRLKSSREYYSLLSADFRKRVLEAKRTMDQAHALDMPTLDALRWSFSGLYPVLRLCQNIPASWEKDVRKALGKNANRVIAAAFEDRLYSEGVFEAVDSATRALCVNALVQNRKPLNWSRLLAEDELECLAEEEPIDWDAVAVREKGYAYCKGKIYDTADYQSVFKQCGYVFEEEKTAGNRVKGTVVFAGGVVHGKAKLVFSVDDLPVFEPDSVLISPMTVPDFLPAIKKAAAIVTDEGGITCHAAIAARELKKPCVIGTKTATKTFNDGDWVEVDSENGVVKKIS